MEEHYDNENEYQENINHNGPSQHNEENDYHENEAKDFQDPTNEVIYEKPNQENEQNMNTDKLPEDNNDREEHFDDNNQPINQEA